MKVTVEQAIAMAKNNESLKGLVIEDLQDTQVRAVDALALAEHGIVLPEQNIYYDDEDIAYDPDFDEDEWREEPLKMTWEEKMHLAEKMEENNLAQQYGHKRYLHIETGEAFALEMEAEDNIRQDEKVKLAKSLLTTSLPNEDIAKHTGLSIEQIEQLRSAKA